MRKYVEWFLIALIMGVLMIFGQYQLHQKSIKIFLIGSYLIILLIMMVFFWMRRKAESLNEETTTGKR